MELRNIETFFWVASLASFRLAAEKLHTTQPTVSQRVAALESDLGVQLFARSARGVTLTDKGHELLLHAEQMLEARRDMLAAAREQNVMRGTVRIGVSETIMQTWLPTLIGQMHAAWPELAPEIDVDTTPMLRGQLLARQLDLAMLMGPVLETGVKNVPLCRYPLAWVASPKLDLGVSDVEPLTLARIAQTPVITYGSASSTYQEVRAMLVGAAESAGITRRPRMFGCASLSMAVKLTRQGIGVAVITPVFLARELADGSLRELTVQACDLPDLGFTASWVHGPDSPVAAAIARLAKRVAARWLPDETPDAVPDATRLPPQ